MNYKSEIKVLEASWLYDNIKPMTVQIYKLNYDFYYEMNEGHNDQEKPNLNESGEQFIVFNNSPEFKDITGFPFHTSLDLLEAKNYVEKTINQKLNWEAEL